MKEIVINYHITERCNYSCKYCFAKYDLKSRFNDELHHELIFVEKLLKEIYIFFRTKYEEKQIRLNLAGGEPLLLSSIRRIIDMAKDIGYQLSIITNSSPLTNNFIKEHAKKFSVIGLSIDSFSNETNIKIGRSTISRKTTGIVDILQKTQSLRDSNPDLHLKINTVVSKYNRNESMTEEINKINPDKWKIFKELSLSSHSMDDKAFHHFVKRNISSIKCPIFIENNDDMTNSYLMIDPLGRFYQNSTGKSSYNYSESILQVGVEHALAQITFDINKFNSRYIPI